MGIFPNPVFESTFSVKFDQELILGEENMVIEATDLNGKVVLSQGSLKVTSSEATASWWLNLAAGTYNLAAMHADSSSAQTFMVTR